MGRSATAKKKLNFSVKLTEDGVRDFETCRCKITLFLCVKRTFDGVTNEQFSQYTRNKQCQNEDRYFGI